MWLADRVQEGQACDKLLFSIYDTLLVSLSLPPSSSLQAEGIVRRDRHGFKMLNLQAKLIVCFSEPSLLPYNLKANDGCSARSEEMPCGRFLSYFW